MTLKANNFNQQHHLLDNYKNYKYTFEPLRNSNTINSSTASTIIFDMFILFDQILLTRTHTNIFHSLILLSATAPSEGD